MMKRGETDMAYNGWTNHETWNVNLWYGDIFADWQEDGSYDTGAAALESFVVEMSGVEEMPDGFAKDAALTALSHVNWDELAEHYAVEEVSEEEDA
jgi:hypothetical protein